MRLVSLLSAKIRADEAAAVAFAPEELRIGVHMPVEHQARQALLAGAELVVVRSELPPPDLARAIDQLSRESGVPVLFASDSVELSRRIEKDDRVLMIAGQMIVPQAALEELAAGEAPGLLATPTEDTTQQFERIDGMNVWAGAALLSGETILSTIDMLGEWDLELTLLRRAVQQDARRIMVPASLAASGRLARIESRDDAERAMTALTMSGFADGPAGDALSAVLAPVSRRVVAQLSRWQVGPSQLGWGTGMLAIFAVAGASAGWPAIGILLALAAEAVLGLHRGCAQVMLRRAAPVWLRVLVGGASLAVLAVAGGQLAEGRSLALAGVGLPLGIIAIEAIADARRKIPISGRASPWRRLTGAMALIIALLGTLGGQTANAFVFIGICALGTVAARLLLADGKYS